MSGIIRTYRTNISAREVEFFMDFKGEARYEDLPIKYQRGFKHIPVPVAEGQFKTLEQEEELFNLINFGGLAQGEQDDDL